MFLLGGVPRGGGVESEKDKHAFERRGISMFNKLYEEVWSVATLAGRFMYRGGGL